MFLYTLAFSALVAGALGKAPFPDGRIVGGKPTTIDKQPHQVSLEILYTQGVYKHVCGGSIIGDNWVLTAAHCMIYGSYPDYYKIRVGSSYKERDGDQHAVSQIIAHPRYDKRTMQNDIAVIKVVQSFKISDNVKVIPMVTQTPAVNSKVVTSGWGVTKQGSQTLPDKLQEVEVFVVDRGVCHEANKHLADVTENMMCAGVSGGGKDACQGDSGGPLVFDGKLCGVVSWDTAVQRRDIPACTLMSPISGVGFPPIQDYKQLS